MKKFLNRLLKKNHENLCDNLLSEIGEAPYVQSVNVTYTKESKPAINVFVVLDYCPQMQFSNEWRVSAGLQNCSPN